MVEIPEVLRRLLGRKPALWIGAGASCQAEPPLPTLWQLASGLREAPIGWDPLPAVDDPYALFDRGLDEGVFQPGELHDYLEAKVRPGGRDPKPGALHHHLAELAADGAFPFVVDTNYDLLLRRAMLGTEAAHTHSVLQQNLSRPTAGCWYLSIHGDLNDWSKIVLTKESYRQFDERYRFLRGQLDLLLIKHPVLFVGCSMTDPRLLDWVGGLDEDARSRLKTWVAVVGLGEKEQLGRTMYEGRSVLEVLGTHVQLVELPSFDMLPRWFGELASPARGRRERAGRELTVEVEASADGWCVEAAGESRQATPPVLGEALVELRRLAGAGLACNEAGELLEPNGGLAEHRMEALAREIGAKITALLPEAGRIAMAKLAGSAAQHDAALIRIRARGPEANAVLLLPWELLLVEDRLPVACDELSIAREAVAEGVEEGLPTPPRELSVVAHVSAPQDDGLPELNLEEAAFRMARVLVSVEDRTLFTDLGTLDDLQRAVERLSPVLLHFAGHGMPGQLVFEDRDGGAEPVPTNRLRLALREAMGKLPSAIWLSCCFGAGSGKAEPGPADRAREWGMLGPQTPSIAADLHRAGVPQVLGYFGPVPDPLAVEVDRTLFEALASSGSTIQAVRAARLRTQRAIDTGHGWARYPLAWTLLGLYHRGPDVPLAVLGTQATDRSATMMRALEREPEDLHGLEALRHGFIGRRRLLATLRRHRDNGRNVLGLHGMGGLGKTATMIRLSRVFAGGGTGWQQRVVVLSLHNLDRSFAALTKAVEHAVQTHPACPSDWEARLRRVEADGDDRGKALARVLLGVLAERVLYVDNAETMQVDPGAGADEHVQVPWCDPEVASFFDTLCSEATSSVTVLVTTRYRPEQTSGTWVAITPCTKDEIFRMMRWLPSLRLLPPRLREELAARRLDGHPRAVEWVDALIKDQADRWLEEGHELRDDADLESVRRNVFEPALAGLPEKVGSDLLLDALIGRLGAGPRALLGECCGIGLPVPLEVVRQLGEGTEALLARGLLTRFEERGWSVHAFVREAVLRGTGVPWTVRGRGVVADYWMAQCRGESGAPGLVWSEALEHLLAAERWSEAKDVVCTTDDHYEKRGWVRARVELLEGVADREWPDAERGIISYRCSDALRVAGRYLDAEGKALDGIAILEQVYNTREHAEVAGSVHGLANVLTSLGRYEEAEQAYKESIAIQERVYKTREHASVAASLSGLANVLERQGRYGEAEQAYKESIAIKERVHKTREHAEVAASVHGLANVFERQGRYGEAEQAYRESIAIQERVYESREHADVAGSLSGLGNVLTSQGRYGDAEQAYKESIAIQERVYKTREHTSVAVSQHGLGNVLTSQGRYGDAEQAYQKSIAIKERVYKTREHASVAASLSGLGNVLTSQGRYGDAEQAYKESIAIQQRVYKTRENAEVAASFSGLGNVLASQGRYGDAEQAYKESIALSERVYETREHASVVASLCGLGNVLTSQGRYGDAEQAYKESIAISERVYETREHASVAASVHGLANVHIARERFEDAERCLREVIAIESAVFGSRRTPITIPTLQSLAELIFMQGRPQDALEYAQDGWEGSVEAGDLLFAVQIGPLYAILLAELGRQEDAQQIGGTVVELLQQLPEEHPVRVAVERRIGMRE